MLLFPVDLDYLNTQQNLVHEIQMQQLQDAVSRNGQLYEYSFQEMLMNSNSSNTYLTNLMGNVTSLIGNNEFQQEEVLNFIEAILHEAITQDKFNIKLKKTGDTQIVLYTESGNNEFKNLAIDEDGDVSYMFFAKNKENSRRKMFFYEDGINITELVSLL